MVNMLKSHKDLKELYCKTRVQFNSEAGIDAGGLTNDAYVLFFEQVLRNYFNHEGGKYLPNDDNSTNLEVYEMLGRAIMKCLLQERPENLPVPSWFFTFLLNQEPNEDDYEKWLALCEEYDHQFAIKLDSLKYFDNLADILPGVEVPCKDGIIGEIVMQPLAKSNVIQYIISKLQRKLRGGEVRMRKMEAIRKGFLFCPETLKTKYLPNLNAKILMLLLCTNQTISADLVLQNMNISLLSRKYQRFMRRFIENSNSLTLKKFLLWTCAYPNIPINGLERKISVRESNQTISHTCFPSLEIKRNLKSYKEFAEHLNTFIDFGYNASFNVI